MSEERNIAHKKHVWDAFIKKGILLPIVYDVETFGLQRDNVPHPVKGTPIITEYSHLVMDIAGNYVDHFQIFPRRPETELGDPAAPLVIRKFPQEFDSKDRIPYVQAMGEILWELEKVPFRYEQAAEKLGDSKKLVNYIKHNIDADELDLADSFNANTDEDEKISDDKVYSEEIINIPLLDDDGNVVHDVRYHPKLEKIAYRVDANPSSPYAMPRLKNNYYVDAEDGSRWKLITPRRAVFGYNNHGFDNAVMRVNFMRAGVYPENLFSMTAQSTLSNKQIGKSFSYDIRNLFRSVVLYGSQGEDKFDFSEKINPANGRPYISESLVGVMKENTRAANRTRGIPGGVTLHDGSIYDEHSAHGALYDVFATQALYKQAMQKSPHILEKILKQADQKYLQDWLSNVDVKDDKLPLFSISVKNYPNAPYETLYAFLGTDVQLGNMKKYIFMKTDGSLHDAKYKGKSFFEFSADEWERYLIDNARNTDAVIRLIPAKKWPYALHMDTVLKETEAGGIWRNNLDDVEQDLVKIKENPEMLANIRRAVENINFRMKQVPGAQNPTKEDDLYKYGFAEPPYLSGVEKNLMETIHAVQVHEYRFLKLVDESMYRLFITPHKIDNIDINNPEIDSVLDNFSDLVKRVKSKFKKKKIDYLGIVEEFTNKYDVNYDKKYEEKLIKSGKDENIAALYAIEYKEKMIANMQKFRWAMKAQFLKAEKAERLNNSLYAQGMVTVNDMFKQDGKKSKLLIANAYRGDGYNTPQIVDAEAGMSIPMSYIEKQDRKTVFDKFNKGEWVSRFYRARSNPAVEIVLTQYADAGKLKDLPEEWQFEYKKYKQLKLYGKPNENEITSALPTIGSYEYELNKIEINASSGNREALERSLLEASGVAIKLDNYDEAKRIIAESVKWIEDIKKQNKFDKSLQDNGLYDPKSGLPYDDIPYEIKDNDYVVIDLPAHHLRNPIEQFNNDGLPHKCLVIEKPSAEIAKAIKQKQKIILREQETGRMYHTGPAKLVKAPDEKDYRSIHLNETSRRAYEQSNQDFPAHPMVLGIEDLYPVANTRQMKPDVQTFKLPKQNFDGLVYHEIANLPKEVSGLIIPAECVAQALEPGKAIRLREASGAMFDNICGDSGDDTGHIYDTKLKGVVKDITLKELFNKVDSGEISQKVMTDYGFQSKTHMQQVFSQYAANMQKPNYEDIPVVIMEFNEVTKEDWGYWNPPEAPVAAMLRGERAVAPSAYRAVPKKNKRKIS